ncbi:MAG: DUF1800 family protein [Anaeromyxobacter sp.]
MADLTPITSWTADDVLHLGRRAGFGLTPEAAAALAAQDPGTAIAAWVGGAGASTAAFDAALAHADPVDQPASGAAGPVAGPHAYLVEGRDAWRNDLSRAQGYLAFRMQYAPDAMRERLGLFWHNLFATGWSKVGSVALMLQQQETLRARALDRFDDLHVAVSKDPAMCIWLDSILNHARGDDVPNENYAREAMELYSLGADNGYNQQDITQLARALSGWAYTVAAADLVQDPNGGRAAARGTFRVYDGSPVSGEYVWWDQGADTLPTQLPDVRATGGVTFLGKAFDDLSTAPEGLAAGEDVLRAIVSERGPQVAQFLARRLVLGFVTGAPVQADLDQVADLVRVEAGFDLQVVLTRLLSSRWFFDPANRFALVEGPVSWTVRAARALGYPLAEASGASAATNRFPAWAEVAEYFDAAGMKLLDPAGPNGWREDLAWLNSGTIRARTRLAAALALGETWWQGGAERAFFPADPQRWFPSAPASPQAVLDRLVALLQPAPIPASVSDGWLAALWPDAAAFAWDAEGQLRARELAYLVLCSPSAQVY